jgi:hypothetical protein
VYLYCTVTIVSHIGPVSERYITEHGVTFKCCVNLLGKQVHELLVLFFFFGSLSTDIDVNSLLEG